MKNAVSTSPKTRRAEVEREYAAVLLNFAAAALSADMSFQTGLNPSAPLKPSYYGGLSTAQQVADFVRAQLPAGNLDKAKDYAHKLNERKGVLCERGVRVIERLDVTAPPNGLAAAPGPYYLFVNGKTPDGPTPSVASVVFLGQTGSLTPAREPLQSSSAAASSGSANPIPADRTDLTQ